MAKDWNSPRSRLNVSSLSPSSSAGQDYGSPFRVVSYNLHSGRSAAGDEVFDQQVEFLRTLSPDLLAVQEVDRDWPRSANVDQSRALALALDMRGFFSPNLLGPWMVGRNTYQYGIAVFWRGGAEMLGGAALPGVPGREHRGLAYVEIETRQGGLIFGNIHLGRSPAERSAQAEFVAEWLTSRSLPTILAGDFNMIPGSPEYHRLVAAATDVTAGLDLVTFPDDVPDRQRDYVFITAGLRAGSVATIDSDLSDHRPVIVEIEFSS